MLGRAILLAILVLTTSSCFKGEWRTSSPGCGPGRAKDAFDDCALKDKSLPTVTLAALSSANPTNVNPIILTATFSEVVYEFGVAGVAVTNGKVSSVSGIAAEYTISITPEKDGDVTVSLLPGAAKDFAGQASAASNQLSLGYDGTAPTLAFTSMDRSALDLTSTANPTLTVVLSENSKVTLYKDNTCSVSVSAAKDLLGTAGQTIQADSIDPVSKTRIHGKAVDAAGNASACTSLVTYTHVMRFVDPNPSASNGFGDKIVELANGNIVITSPQADINSVNDAGAVYLFNGNTGALISTLYGSTASDNVGGGIAGGVTALTNGNFVVRSPSWDCQAALGCAGTVNSVGAATLVSGTAGINGPVTAANSLIGTTTNDQIGSSGVAALTNGNYVVASPSWTCQPALGCAGTVAAVGAATWANGKTGITGQVTASNSLIGTTASDNTGSSITALTNGNYVVRSTSWDCQATLGCAGTVTEVGAMTFGNGTTGITGQVTAANSLIGTTTNDFVGNGNVTALTNGNYVVASYNWDCQVALGCAGGVVDVGAVTFANGTTGITGQVTAANSLIGTTATDQVGGTSVTALTNGNYVVASMQWDCQAALGCAGTVAGVGAVTFANGTAGITGQVTAANSLIGTTLNDNVGQVTALTNGNYVVASIQWDCQAALGCAGTVAGVGAVTFGNGITGITGQVTAANSLIGTAFNDFVGSGVTALTNGNYVVRSVSWDCQAALGCAGFVADVGAITFASGTAGVTGQVTASNSLIGSTTTDQVGTGGVKALANGNYIVGSWGWDCQPALGCAGTVTNVGAVTWGNGTTGITGVVSATNSLVGSTANDYLGYNMTAINFSIYGLANGNYVVASSSWNCQASLGCSGTLADVGAITWGNGATGTIGTVTANNSLVGSTLSDQVGNDTYAVAIADGHLIIRSSLWGASDPMLILMIPGTDAASGSL